MVKGMEQFCKHHNIDYQLCGKIIVALNEEKFPVCTIFFNGKIDNCKIISREEMLEIEPHVAGVQAGMFQSVGELQTDMLKTGPNNRRK